MQVKHGRLNLRVEIRLLVGMSRIGFTFRTYFLFPSGIALQERVCSDLAINESIFLKKLFPSPQTAVPESGSLQEVEIKLEHVIFTFFIK
jgi:hypothetical protein